MDAVVFSTLNNNPLSISCPNGREQWLLQGRAQMTTAEMVNVRAGLGGTGFRETVFPLIDKEADERPTGKEVDEGLRLFPETHPDPNWGRAVGFFSLGRSGNTCSFSGQAENGNSAQGCHFG